MENKDLKMVTQISKIITNTLNSEGGINLPSIGIIEIIDGRPTIVDKEGYTSLVDILKSMGGVSDEQAKDLYDKWLELVKVEEVRYEIDMIGSIKDGEIEVGQRLFSRLNSDKESKRVVSVTPEEIATPEEPTPTVEQVTPSATRTTKTKYKTKEKAKSNNTTLIIAAAVIVLAIIAVVALSGDKPSSANEPTVAEIVTPKSETVVVAEQESVAQPIPEVQPIPEAKPQPEVESTKVESTPESSETLYTKLGEEPSLRTFKGRTASSEDALAALDRVRSSSSEVASKSYQVVLGTYTRPANAGRLIIDFETFRKQNPIPTYVTEYGKSTIVSLFGADSRQECEEYIATIGKDITSTLWVCKTR